ncbi:hypothetical protein FRC04_000976 [Tulasnella sp. 424]|nr:hypothetical protein FRC04_000976 [Tulasnella sp. 424]
MPAMSPTMTEGGIAKWKKKEGESFETGEILLEIVRRSLLQMALELLGQRETDKATMDVEAQDDGIMGKIIVSDGAKGVPVGKVIALLAEEGDDISNLEVPKEDGASAAPSESQQSSSPPPSTSQPSSSTPKSEPAAARAPEHQGPYHPHSKHPIFPSVLRLLQEHNLSTDVDSLGIKGTGIRGMLTKGDVLAHLGLARGPMGTFTPPKLEQLLGTVGLEKKVGGGEKKVEEVKKSWTADEVRRAIMAGLEKQVKPAALPTQEHTFDSILGDYIKTPKSAASTAVPPAALPKQSSSSSSYLDGLI